MAGALRDGEDELRGSPPFSLFAGPGAFGAAVVFAAAGMPVGVLAAPAPEACPVFGVTGGPDLTTALVAFVARALGANAALQAVAPGAAYFVPVRPTLAGVAATGAAAQLFTLAAAQLADRAGLPAVGDAFARRPWPSTGRPRPTAPSPRSRPPWPACRWSAAPAR